jgi:hypothetical protein
VKRVVSWAGSALESDTDAAFEPCLKCDETLVLSLGEPVMCADCESELYPPLEYWLEVREQ